MASTLFLRSLDRIEALGNRLPPPAWLFVWLCGIVLVASAIAAGLGWQASWPDGSKTVSAVNLISLVGLNHLFNDTVSNFTGFAPVGNVVVAMLGLGLAERSGLLAGLLSSLVRISGVRALPTVVALAGVLSSIAVDAGYVVVIPLAGLLFQRAGLPPLAGIACAFAGVSGGFSANVLIGPVDALLAGIATEALQTVKPGAEVAVTANYFFMLASTLWVTLIVSWVNHQFVMPRLSATASATPLPRADLDDSYLHPAGAKIVLIWTMAVLAFALLGLLPADGFLRAEDGSITKSPLIKGVVVLVALYAGIAGILYARVSGRWARSSDAIPALEETLKTLASYLVLMFFAAQFVAYFQWSQIGQLVAITGAENLRALDWSPVTLLLLFVLFTVTLDLLIGSASAKWALMAPVFIPMFFLAGIPAEGTLAAYRVGDSVANIITPLMPYFAMVVAFAQRFEPKAGIGTLMAMMLPYSLMLLIGWGGLLALWLSMGWPLGPG